MKWVNDSNRWQCVTWTTDERTRAHEECTENEDKIGEIIFIVWCEDVREEKRKEFSFLLHVISHVILKAWQQVERIGTSEENCQAQMNKKKSKKKKRDENGD